MVQDFGIFDEILTLLSGLEVGRGLVADLAKMSGIVGRYPWDTEADLEAGGWDARSTLFVS